MYLLTVEKELVEKINEKYQGNVEDLEEIIFIWDMDSRIGDWAYYNALGYCLKVAKGENVDHYGVV